MQGFRRFVDTKPTEKAQFDDLSLPRIHLGQRVQSIVQCRYIATAGRAADFQSLFERHMRHVFPSFSVAPARVINKDAAHQLSRYREEVDAVLPLDMLAIEKANVDFVHQSGSL